MLHIKFYTENGERSYQSFEVANEFESFLEVYNLWTLFLTTGIKCKKLIPALELCHAALSSGKIELDFYENIFLSSKDEMKYFDEFVCAVLYFVRKHPEYTVNAWRL